MAAMNPQASDTAALHEQQSPLVQRVMKAHLQHSAQQQQANNKVHSAQQRKSASRTHSQSGSAGAQQQQTTNKVHSAQQRKSASTRPHSQSGSAGMETQDLVISRTGTVAVMSEILNMGALVHTDNDLRIHSASLDKFVNSDSFIYPFEVHVSLELPKPNDIMWDFKHNFFLSIMYSQVYRYFFPFNRHNSQLFFVMNENQSDVNLQCVNIPSRIAFHKMKMQSKPLENILMAAVSAYKDYLAFFRLTSKPHACPEPYNNFCYVPPVWTNKLQ